MKTIISDAAGLDAKPKGKSDKGAKDQEKPQTPPPPPPQDTPPEKPAKAETHAAKLDRLKKALADANTHAHKVRVKHEKAEEEMVAEARAAERAVAAAHKELHVFKAGL